MHLLYSTALGTDVVDDGQHLVHGRVSELLVDPDRGGVVALEVSGGVGQRGVLQTQDILSWGHRVHVRSPEVIGPAEDIVRLQGILADPRRLIGQSIRTRSGVRLGRCKDFQFNTKTFTIDWILPWRFFLRGHPIPRSDILEVTKQAIVVKDPVKTERVREESGEKVALALPEEPMA